MFGERRASGKSRQNACWEAAERGKSLGLAAGHCEG
jgi:hypothetical protein